MTIWGEMQEGPFSEAEQRRFKQAKQEQEAQ